jgi:hypothetical protein
MMEAVRTSETSVDNYFKRQYIPEDNSELHTRRRENLKSHKYLNHLKFMLFQILEYKQKNRGTFQVHYTIEICPYFFNSFVRLV